MKIISQGQHGGSRYLPYAFTEQGVAMLSGILNSDRAIQMNKEQKTNI
ncbi:MAG: ORF6N domain-containing protein [Niabella sp.]